MAKGKKTGGANFKPGVSGNPNGRPPVPEDLKALRSLNQIEFETVANTLLRLTRDELKDLLEDRKTPALTVLVARVIRTATWSGDPKRLDFLMNRLIGKAGNQKAPDELPDARKKAAELTDEQIEKRIAIISKRKISGRA